VQEVVEACEALLEVKVSQSAARGGGRPGLHPGATLEEQRLAFADDPGSESACVTKMPMPNWHAYARLEAELRETHE
jgi:hypothetical protein